ncbi:MAG: hypothetical protein IT288_03230 [Bdellovibrionales bacterium]|nr:hypothetical protein [Bdellovibrionales bacterium]
MNRFLQRLNCSLIILACFFALPATGTGSGGGTSGTEGGGNAAPGRNPNINQGARRGESSQNRGAQVNFAAGVVFTGICATRYGSWACPMAAMSFLQAAHDMAASGDSGDVGDLTDPGGWYTPPPGTPGGTTPTTPGTRPPPPGPGGGPTTFATINENLRNLANMGYRVNPATGTVSTPKGDMPMSAFSSPQAMAEAGFDQASVNAAKETLDKLNAQFGGEAGDKANVVAMGLDSRGGGGGGMGDGSEMGGGSGSDPMAAYLASLKNKMNNGRGPASVAGMQRMAGGEPIGVKMDNIFEMIHRRYQKKRKANTFIETNLVEPAAKGKSNF